MKEKIIVLNIFFMLLIGSVFVGAVKINLPKNNSFSLIENMNENDAELPVWKNGDSWTYDITMKGKDNSGDIAFDLSFINLKFTVTSDSGNNYKLSLNGDFSGSGSYLGILSGQINDGKISGQQYVEKSSLATVKMENSKITGKVSILQFDVDISNLDYTPFYPNFDFPINVGESWGVETSVMNLIGYINKPAVVEGDLFLEIHIGGYTANCEKKENKEGYESLKIKQNKTNCWYAPDAGNIVYAKNTDNIKLYMWGLPEYYYEITSFEMKLKNTNYEPPNDPPSSPDAPSGETDGRAGVEYSYCTAGADDPNNDQVQYGFDWNDDDSIDDWTDSVNSGSEACISHAFESAGTYRIKVKAKDSKGAESEWSPELTVQMAQNNVPRTPDTPSGTTQGIAGEEYSYLTNTVTDPDGDDITYEFNWGDGDTTTGLTTPSATHIWTSKGNFNVKVRAKDEYGAASEWSGELAVYMDNNIPEIPAVPDGPATGRKNIDYTYTSFTTDADGHQIYYKFDWGDGSDSGWLGPINSGNQITATHSWSSKGDYNIKVKAKDGYGEETDWSDPLPIQIPRNRLFPSIFNQMIYTIKNILSKLDVKIDRPLIV